MRYHVKWHWADRSSDEPERDIVDIPYNTVSYPLMRQFLAAKLGTTKEAIEVVSMKLTESQ